MSGIGFAVFIAACLVFPRVSHSSSMLLYRVFELKPKVFLSVPDDVIDQDCDPEYNRAGVAGFIATSEGVVVVDTSNSPMSGRDLLYEIRHRTDLPIRYVINTGSAPDHMLGNEVFSDELATIISTRAAQAEVEQYARELQRRFHAEDGWRLQDRMRGFHVTPATQTFSDTMSFTMGGKEVRLKSMQSDGGAPEDASVYLPADKILFLGDLFQNHYFPQVGQRDVRKWIQALHNLEMWDIDTYVPGHGAPGGKNDLEDFRKFLEWSVAQIEMRLKQGKSPEDIVKDLRIVQTYRWHAPERAQDFVLDICRQLAPPTNLQPPASPAPAPPSPVPSTPQAQ